MKIAVNLQGQSLAGHFHHAEKKGYSGTAIFTKERPLKVTPHIGIAEHERDSVLAENIRGANAGSIPGRGLGLSIVRQNIQAHGGSVTIEAAEGTGTVVRLTLPCPAQTAN